MKTAAKIENRKKIFGPEARSFSIDYENWVKFHAKFFFVSDMRHREYRRVDGSLSFWSLQF